MKSIRSKLAVFVTGLCALLLLLVWVLTVVMFEPNYHRMLNAELSRRLSGVVSIMEAADSVEDVAEQLNGYVKEGVCIDISDSRYRCVGISEGIGSSCMLHKNSAQSFGLLHNSVDSATAINLRQITAQQGSVQYTLEEESGGRQQVVVGQRTANGYIVLVSMNLERVTQAVDIMKTQLTFISVVLLVVSVAAAMLFSRWFTRPITRLSGAARRVAAGDYNAVVEPIGKDEIGVLMRDFNEMTTEIAKTSQLQKELLANVSHDLRTPLTLIKGYAETARDLDGDNEVRRREDLDIIIDETDRLSGLVNSVMELSKYSSGTLPPKLIDFDLAELADDVVSKYTDRALKEGFSITRTGLSEAMVVADAAQIERVLHNFVANAVGHLGENGAVTLGLYSVNESTVRVEVSDNGSGIPQEELPHLFDRYYRARSDEGKKGNGLGLSIVKAILISHNANFGVRSTLGSGSSFWFELQSPQPQIPAAAPKNTYRFKRAEKDKKDPPQKEN